MFNYNSSDSLSIFQIPVDYFQGQMVLFSYSINLLHWTVSFSRIGEIIERNCSLLRDCNCRFDWYNFSLTFFFKFLWCRDCFFHSTRLQWTALRDFHELGNAFGLFEGFEYARDNKIGKDFVISFRKSFKMSNVRVFNIALYFMHY